jgi:hypothetical protein
MATPQETMFEQLKARMVGYLEGNEKIFPDLHYFVQSAALMAFFGSGIAITGMAVFLAVLPPVAVLLMGLSPPLLYLFTLFFMPLLSLISAGLAGALMSPAVFLADSADKLIKSSHSFLASAFASCLRVLANVLVLPLAFLAMPFRILATGLRIAGVSSMFLSNTRSNLFEKDPAEQTSEAFQQLFAVRFLKALFVRGLDLEEDIFNIVEKGLLYFAKALHYLTVGLVVDVIARGLMSPAWLVQLPRAAFGWQVPENIAGKIIYSFFNGLSKLLAIPAALFMLVATAPGHLLSHPLKLDGAEDLIKDVEELRKNIFALPGARGRNAEGRLASRAGSLQGEDDPNQGEVVEVELVAGNWSALFRASVPELPKLFPGNNNDGSAVALAPTAPRRVYGGGTSD